MSERPFIRAIPVPGGVDEAPAPAANIIVPDAEATPTSRLLPPVLERRVSTRRRRLAQAPVPVFGFPCPPCVRRSPLSWKESTIVSRSSEDLSPPTRDKARTATHLKTDSFEISEKRSGPSFPENDIRIQAMSQEEIADALSQIRSRLTPDTVAFFENRRRASVLKDSVPSDDICRLKQNYPDSRIEHTCDLDEDPGDESHLLSDVRVKHVFREKVELAKVVSDVLDLKHLEHDRDEVKDKLAWTQSADEGTSPNEARPLDVGAAALKSVTSLGHVADWRFDLNGRRLSAEQIQNLPTHIGLHHHGLEPESAGYTLAEVALLCRSSVLGQRVLAYNILAGIVSHHGKYVLYPFEKAGGLATVLVEDSTSGVHSGRTHHMTLLRAYLRLISSLLELSDVARIALYDADDLELRPEQLYYASSLYSAYLDCQQAKTRDRIFHALTQSGCAQSMVRIAYACYLAGNTEDSILALTNALIMVSLCRDTSSTVLTDSTCVSNLIKLASSGLCMDFENERFVSGSEVATCSGTVETSRSTYVDFAGEPGFSVLRENLDIRRERSSVLYSISCHIIARCVVAYGWRSEPESMSILNRVLVPHLLTALQTYVNVFACSNNGLPLDSAGRLLLAIAAMRVFRSGIAFGKCLDICSGALSGLVSLARLSEAAESIPHVVDAGIEAFLMLEAYAYAVLSRITSLHHSEGTKPMAFVGPFQTNRNQDQVRADESAELALLHEQIVLLLPFAVESVVVFTGSSTEYEFVLNTTTDRRRMAIRSAAGHFVATVVAMTFSNQAYITAEVLKRVRDVAQIAVRQLRKVASSVNPQPEWPVFCFSMLHAASRLLARTDLGSELLEALSDHVVEIASSLSKNHKCESDSSEKCEAIAAFTKPSNLKGNGENTHPAFSPATMDDVAAHSCAEVLGVISKARPNKRLVRAAFSIACHVRDPQVLADLTARSILDCRVLQGLECELEMQERLYLTERLVPAILASILSMKIDKDESFELKGCPSEWQLLSLWLRAAREADENNRALLELAMKSIDGLRCAGALDSHQVYRALILVADDSCITMSSGSSVRLWIRDAGLGSSPGFNLPGAPHTALEAGSTAPLQPLAQKLLDLADLLVRLGPDDRENAILASVVLSAILCRGTDMSLRLALWQRCVVECGGMALFAGADVYGASGNVSDVCRDDIISGTDAMAGHYALALARGIRCERDCVLRSMWSSVWAVFVCQADGPSFAPGLREIVESRNGRERLRSALGKYGLDVLSDNQYRIIEDMLTETSDNVL